MLWSKSKNGDYLIRIVESVTKTETNIDNLTKTVNEQRYMQTKHIEKQNKDMSEIFDKLKVCPEEKRIGLVETQVYTDINKKDGSIKTWRLIAAILGAMGVVTGIICKLMNIF